MLAAAKAKADEERAERRATVYLPKAGEPGAARLRNSGRFHLTRHQDTSATLAGAYPFVVAQGGRGRWPGSSAFTAVADLPGSFGL